jgi:hypothetical protein
VENIDFLKVNFVAGNSNKLRKIGFGREKN